jgi:hypothetical protein
MSGSCNDISILQRSPLITQIEMGEGLPVECEANGNKYNYGYYLPNCIYPKWCAFVKPVVDPKGSCVS